MMTFGRVMYDAFGLTYAVSLVLFFVDAIEPRRNVNRTALLLLFVAFMSETGFLLLRLKELGHVPVYSRFDSLLLLSWLVMVIALVVDAFYRVDLFLFFANLLGFSIAVTDAFARQERLMYTKHQGDLLVLHISFAIMSYAAFAFAFVFSLMYLIQERFLRQKQWTRWYFRLPSLDRLDTYTARSVLIGFPLFSVAIVLGVVWAKLSLGVLLLTDPKSIFTLGLWAMYGLFIALHYKNGWGGKRLMWYNVVCFICTVLNFILIGSLSVVHRTA
jgi:HemX protein